MELKHIFTWELQLDGWPAIIIGHISYEFENRIMVYVDVRTLGVDRAYQMHWIPDETCYPRWQFVDDVPAEIMELEEEIGDTVICFDTDYYL